MRTTLAALLLLVQAEARAGDIAGVVRFAGTGAPPAADLAVTKDRGTCGDSQPDESLVAAGGLLANVVVYVKGAPGVRAEPRALVLDQQRCRFTPRVQTAPVGSTLEIRNDDPILHNVHGWEGRRTAFNVPMTSKGERVTRALARPGLVKVGCDVHSWMQAFVWVADGPASVTGSDGRFTLRGLPPGPHVVAAWHERLGETSAQVVVPPSGDVQLQLELGR